MHQFLKSCLFYLQINVYSLGRAYLRLSTALHINPPAIGMFHQIHQWSFTAAQHSIECVFVRHMIQMVSSGLFLAGWSCLWNKNDMLAILCQQISGFSNTLYMDFSKYTLQVHVYQQMALFGIYLLNEYCWMAISTIFTQQQCRLFCSWITLDDSSSNSIPSSPFSPLLLKSSSVSSTYNLYGKSVPCAYFVCLKVLSCKEVQMQITIP